MARIDILGLGAVAIDDLLYVSAYPPPDQKIQVLRRERQCGGLTATCLVAAARLGARCAYAGVLGEDELSHAAVRSLASEGIDLSFLVRRPGARPIYATVVSDQAAKTRNIFFDYAGVVGAAEDWPPEEVIRSCRVLFVDHLGVPGMIRAAEIARAAGIPVVADLERVAPRFDELLWLSNHLIVSWEFARDYTRAVTPAEAALRLWAPGRALSAVTCGADGGWYVTRESQEKPRYYPAFEVDVVDTTGCGDIFHGAYAAGLAQGLNVHLCIRRAAAAAAIKATTCGGQAGAPTAKDLDLFLRERNGSPAG